MIGQEKKEKKVLKFAEGFPQIKEILMTLTLLSKTPGGRFLFISGSTSATVSHPGRNLCPGADEGLPEVSSMLKISLTSSYLVKTTDL